VTPREVIARHSASFALAARLLPARCRDDASVIYAWCRRADDAVDLAPPAARAGAIVRLRAELDDVYRGSARDPLLAAFAGVVRRTRIPCEYPGELLEGMAMDERGETYPSLDALLLYAYRVAGTVGLMMCHVMRTRDDAAIDNAVHLGIAMQLTNICRDVIEDWDRGRLYVPADRLARCGAPGLAAALGGPFPARARAAMAAAVADLLIEADRYYASAERGMAALPWRCAVAIRAAAWIYAAIGRRIEAARCDVTAGRAFVPLARKLALAGGAIARSAAELPGRALRRDRIATPTRLLTARDLRRPR
jgi:phytoene synthase